MNKDSPAGVCDCEYSVPPQVIPGCRPGDMEVRTTAFNGEHSNKDVHDPSLPLQVFFFSLDFYIFFCYNRRYMSEVPAAVVRVQKKKTK